MEFINSVLKLIGIITILYWCYILNERRQNFNTKKQKQYNQLVSLLRIHHPEIKKLFDKYEAEQHTFSKSGNRVSHYLLFGKGVYSVYPESLKYLEHSVTDKIKELQSTPEGIEAIKQIKDNWEKLLNHNE